MQGLVRAVRVAGLGDVRVRVREGEVLRLRHVVGGACGRSVRTRRSRFSRQHAFRFESLGSDGNIIDGRGVEVWMNWKVGMYEGV